MFTLEESALLARFLRLVGRSLAAVLVLIVAWLVLRAL